jgi:ribonuclease HI
MIKIYTDGSSTKNRSGWGFVVVLNDEVIFEKAGTEHKGDTNQLMELIAAIEACDWIMNNYKYMDGNDVIIYSDSAYLVNCYKDKWWVNWINNGWLNSKKEPVANADCWKILIPFFKRPEFTFEKVKGHSGHVYNERADMLAQGKLQPTDADDLTTNKKYDTIYIELSEIMLNYSMDKTSVKRTIDSIISIMKREGVSFE